MVELRITGTPPENPDTMAAIKRGFNMYAVRHAYYEHGFRVYVSGSPKPRPEPRPFEADAFVPRISDYGANNHAVLIADFSAPDVVTLEQARSIGTNMAQILRSSAAAENATFALSQSRTPRRFVINRGFGWVD